MALIMRKVVLVANTAKLIATTGFGDPVILQNLSGVSVYLGSDATVDNTNGFLLTVSPAVNSRLNLLNYAGEIWGYAVAGAGDIRVLECVSG